MWHYNFISLYSICDKICLQGCSIWPIKFSKISNFMKYTLNNSNISFHIFLHSWEFTLRVISLFTICIKNVFNCCLLYFIRLSTESWESWESWEIEQTVWESHGIFFFCEKSWEIHGIFLSCIRENLIWLLLNTLLEVFVAESIKLIVFTCKD